MEKDAELVTIHIDLLTELLNIRKLHYQICDEFKIPIKKRSEKWVAPAIIERIHTYLTSYIGRRSLIEKENGAAFREEKEEDIQDPQLYETPQI